MRTILAALMLFVASPLVAQAAQEVEPELEVGLAIICDTPEQMTKLVQRWDGHEDSAPSLIEEINAEETEKPHACGLNTWAFVPLGDGDRVGNWTLEHVLVLGVMTSNGPMKIDPPQEQWTAYITPGVGI